MPGKWVNTPIGPVWVPDGWKIWVSKPRIGNIKGKDPRKFVDHLVRVTIRDPRTKGNTLGNRRKRRNKHHVATAMSRYRERDLAGSSPLFRKDIPAKLGSQHKLGVLSRYVGGVKQAGLGGPVVVGGDLTESVSWQRTWDQVNPGPPFRSGGPFKSILYHLPASTVVGHGRFSSEGRPGIPQGTFDVYTGGFADNGFWLGPSYSSIQNSGLGDIPNLSQYHSSAWDRTKPKLPEADLGQFLVELRDLPRMLLTSAQGFRQKYLIAEARFTTSKHDVLAPYMRPREVADHFLNHEFGWKPFLKDLMKLFDVWNNSVEKIARIVRDNGVWVRKRRVLEESDETSVETVSGSDSGTIPSSEMRGPTGSVMCFAAPSPVGSVRGYCAFSNRVKRKVWAVGSFKYYRPEFDMGLFNESSYEQLASVKRLMTIYGARISPSLLYKVTPWTWLIDWFTNLGDHLERLEDFTVDGITARYLYVMRQEEKFYTKTCVLNFYSGPVAVHFQRRLAFKQREVADSPYGFNSPWNSLSPRQLAILGAIGTTRSNRGFISHGA